MAVPESIIQYIGRFIINYIDVIVYALVAVLAFGGALMIGLTIFHVRHLPCHGRHYRRH